MSKNAQNHPVFFKKCEKMLKYCKKSRKNRKKFQKMLTFTLPIPPKPPISTPQTPFLTQNQPSPIENRQ